MASRVGWREREAMVEVRDGQAGFGGGRARVAWERRWEERSSKVLRGGEFAMGLEFGGRFCVSVVVMMVESWMEKNLLGAPDLRNLVKENYKNYTCVREATCGRP